MKTSFNLAWIGLCFFVCACNASLMSYGKIASERYPAPAIWPDTAADNRPAARYVRTYTLQNTSANEDIVFVCCAYIKTADGTVLRKVEEYTLEPLAQVPLRIDSNAGTDLLKVRIIDAYREDD